jgi:hypothetical protein
MNSALTIKEYQLILEQIELTEEQRDYVGQMLTEGLLESLGRSSLVVFLKIIKVLWDAGWYTVGHPIRSVGQIYSAVKKLSKITLATGAATGTVAGAYIAKPTIDNAYMYYNLGSYVASQLEGTVRNISNLTKNAPKMPDREWKGIDFINPVKYAEKARDLTDYVGQSWGYYTTQINTALEPLKEMKALYNWNEMTMDQKRALLESLGLGTDAYKDALLYLLQLSNDNGVYYSLILVAMGLTMLAARVIGKFVSGKLDDLIQDLQQGSGSTSSAQPATDTPQITANSQSKNNTRTEPYIKD